MDAQQRSAIIGALSKGTSRQIKALAFNAKKLFENKKVARCCEIINAIFAIVSGDNLQPIMTAILNAYIAPSGTEATSST